MGGNQMNTIPWAAFVYTVGSCALLGSSLLLFACATIIHGTRQDVGISSNPTAANVSIDGQSNGTTPVVAHLTRKENHIVKIELAGYKPYETTVTRSASGWVWGNIV